MKQPRLHSSIIFTGINLMLHQLLKLNFIPLHLAKKSDSDKKQVT